MSGDDPEPETVGQALRQAARYLSAQGVPGAARDARLLMADAMDIDPGRLTLHDHDILSDAARATFGRHVARRSGREPVSRILGRRLFYGRWFQVTPFVLDPRPETEILVEQALSQPFGDVLDLGTGSGCIALTLLAEQSGATAIATDLSPDALETAAANASALGLSGRVHFEVSDWFSAVGGTYDLIVSNPPYIHPDELSALDPEVARHDPKIALTDTEDGLIAYRRIAAGARDHLAPGGRLLVEIGPTQAEMVQALFHRAGLSEIAVQSDLDGRDRVISARNPG